MKKQAIWVTLAFFCAALVLFLGKPAFSGQQGLIKALQSKEGVPKTGQTVSYTPGDDGDLQKGLDWPVPRFTINLNSQGESDGTVTDNLTGLVWTQNARIWQYPPIIDWEDACDKCNQLADGVGGLSDESVAGNWRLPNVRELLSLIHYGVNWPAVPNTEGTGKCTSVGDPFTFLGVGWYYWTSTTRDSWIDHALYVNIKEGGVYEGGIKEGYHRYVWCVRDEK